MAPVKKLRILKKEKEAREKLRVPPGVEFSYRGVRMAFDPKGRLNVIPRNAPRKVVRKKKLKATPKLKEEEKRIKAELEKIIREREEELRKREQRLEERTRLVSKKEEQVKAVLDTVASNLPLREIEKRLTKFLETQPEFKNAKEPVSFDLAGKKWLFVPGDPAKGSEPQVFMVPKKIEDLKPKRKKLF